MKKEHTEANDQSHQTQSSLVNGFFVDQLKNGRRYRILNVVDDSWVFYGQLISFRKLPQLVRNE